MRIAVGELKSPVMLRMNSFLFDFLDKYCHSSISISNGSILSSAYCLFETI